MAKVKYFKDLLNIAEKHFEDPDDEDDDEDDLDPYCADDQFEGINEERGNLSGNIDEVPEQCGARFLSGLSEIDDYTQEDIALLLAWIMEEEAFGCYIFSDTSASSNFSCGKKFATMFPKVYNPNSGHIIYFYQLDREQIMQMYNDTQPDEVKKVIKKKKKVKAYRH